MAEFRDQLRDISKDIQSESTRLMNDAQERAAAFIEDSQDLFERTRPRFSSAWASDC